MSTAATTRNPPSHHRAPRSSRQRAVLPTLTTTVLAVSGVAAWALTMGGSARGAPAVHGDTLTVDALGDRADGPAPVVARAPAPDAPQARTVTVVADGRRIPLDTAAPSVLGVLAQAGVVLGPQDTVSASPQAPAQPGMVITVQRVSTRTDAVQQSIPFPTVTRDDPTLPAGTSEIVTLGVPGLRTTTSTTRLLDGVPQPSGPPSAVVTRPPTAEIVRVGTRSPSPSPSPSDSGLDWSALARCESGGNPHAVDPTGSYYGLYQFTPATWQAVGGSGLPSKASPAEQTARAEQLMARSGQGQWPVCGTMLHH